MSSAEKDMTRHLGEEHSYYPGMQRGWGCAVWRGMAVELIHSRQLIWRLFRRDFTARYKQTVLGVAWALVMPLIVVGTFVMLNRSGVLNIGDTGIPYPVYALLGLTIWQLFGSGLTACSAAIVSGGAIVVKINFPKETLVIGALGEAVVELLVRMVLLVAVFAIFHVTPHWTVVFFPLTLLPLALFTLGIGFMLALLNVISRDVPNVVTLLTTFLMFLTPVVYPSTGKGLFGAITTYNPLAAMVTAARDTVVTGYLTQPVQFAWASVLAVFIFLLSWRVFHMVEPRMAERV